MILVVVLLMFIYRKGCFANKLAIRSVEVKPQPRANTEAAAPPTETLPPVDGRKRQHSRLDAMSSLAKSVAARAMTPGQRDIELARLAAHQKSGMAAPAPASASAPAAPTSASPPAISPDQLALSVGGGSTTRAADVAQLGDAVRRALEAGASGKHLGATAVDVEAGNPEPVANAKEWDEEPAEPKTPTSPLKRAGSAFVEKIGWMSTKSAKRLGKTPVKGPEAEAMAHVAAISAQGACSVKDDDRRASCSNKFTSTPL